MSLSRRKMLLAMAAAGAASGCGVTGAALANRAGISSGNFAVRKQPKQDRPRTGSGTEKATSELFTKETEEAVARGLAHLARKQVQTGGNRGAFGSTGYSAGVATTGLAGLAFMCGGFAPNEGKFGKHVDRCAEFIMRNTRQSGYIARADNLVHENMYGHGFAMLFLAEAYGMSLKEEVGEKLEKAVDLTCKCQNGAGGWRYKPEPQSADLSITVCQIMGLRAARDAGIHVPDEVREKCIKYVKDSHAKDGSFRYTIGGHSTFAMTAAGVTSLYSAGIYDGELVEKALEYLNRYKPPSSGGESHFFYGHYYAVQAMWHAGGDYWNEWYPAIRDLLLKRQQSNGSWNCPMAGPEFGTAMASIILQIPLNYLPVFAP